MTRALLFALVLAQGQPADLPRRGTPEWRAMKKRIAYDRVRARYLRDEEASILKGLQGIERNLDARRKAMQKLAREIAALDVRLSALEDQRRFSKAALDEFRRQAGQRAAAMLRLRRESIARIVHRIQDPLEAQQLRDRFRFVLAHDAGLLRGARVADAAVLEAEEGLAEERAARAVTRAQLEIEIEEEALLEEERKALAEAVRTERVAAERLVRELASAARRLEEEMTRIRGDAPAPEPAPGGFRAQRGRLPWPTAGRVEVTFGKRVDPGSGVVLVSNGLDLRAPQSAEVRAVHDGRVVYAGPFEGFGRMVIVAHAGGFFSLYAHLESFAVRVGTSVAQYQLLGFVGDTGSTKGAYLYFELRDGRTPIDPLAWLVDN